MLCPQAGEKCEKGSKWLVDWGPPDKVILFNIAKFKIPPKGQNRK